MAVVQHDTHNHRTSYPHSHDSGSHYRAGRSIPKSFTEINLDPLQIPAPVSPTSYNNANLKEHLFLLGHENILLREENGLLRSYLSTREREETWNTTLIGARASHVPFHHANELVLKIQFMEQLLDLAVDLGILDDQNLGRLEREMERRTAGLCTEDIEEDTVQVIPQVTANVRPYTPRFLEPIATVNSITSKISPTTEQLEALFSIERLVAPLSTDLGSLESSSQDSCSVYSSDSSSVSITHEQTTAGTTPTIEQVTHPKAFGGTTAPKSRLPVRAQKSLASLRAPNDNLASPSQLPKPTVFSKPAQRPSTSLSRTPSPRSVKSTYPTPRTTSPIVHRMSPPKSPCIRRKASKLGAECATSGRNVIGEGMGGRRSLIRK
ncbi:hypothetical protein AAF712_005020 [Marasmius tenuissimus]|uniref:Uncharacterized protein n=1 Tax=Marasmius tenuissimus TaxID=585030 RepID=A0ABR3A3B1_9AGAR